MPYYTNRQGVIPNTMPDDSPGWILVPDPPIVPDDKELVWLNWEWVVRDSKPITEGIWKFIHSEFKSNTESNGWVRFEPISVSNVNTSPEVSMVTETSQPTYLNK